MPDTDIASERRQSLIVRDALFRLIGKLQNSRTATPSELSVLIRKGGNRSSLLFLWMATTAVAGKYQHAGKHHIAIPLMQQRLIIQHLFATDDRSWTAADPLRDSGGRLHAFCGGRKRISQHQSRWMGPDLDIILCAGGAFSIDFGVTPWVCQQADLRYRWTAQGESRLAYLADCWDAYSRSEFTWTDRLIGLQDFPNHSGLC